MRRFFFSSRRRHTRSTRDWSSDVCSSDLVDQGALADTTDTAGTVAYLSPGVTLHVMRSEERRVGKECRSRGSGAQQKKKATEKVRRAAARFRCMAILHGSQLEHVEVTGGW